MKRRPVGVQLYATRQHHRPARVHPSHARMKQPASAPVAPQPAILLLEDDSALQLILVQFLAQHGFRVAVAGCLGEARALFHAGKPWTTVISDYHLPDGTGLDFCRWVHEQPTAAPPILLMSGGLRGELPALAGVTFFAKPFALARLEAFVHAALRQSTEARDFLTKSGSSVTA